VVAKPSDLFARDDEWDELSRFVGSDRVGVRMAVVAGRRRQGKTTLLQALSDQWNGFYWQARQQSSAQNLASFGAALGVYLGTPGPVLFETWEVAVDALVGALADRDGPALAVIDEVGYLVAGEPGFPSHVQAALAPRGAARRKGRARIILCGSAFGQMRKLIDADSPLRGRSDVEMTLRPFGFRESAEFWGLTANVDAAFRLHALVGGTPAYREYADDRPADGDIDGWAQRNLLNTVSPLFREGRVVIAEDPALADQSLYWGVLGAVAEGAARRGEIADVLGRSTTSLAHAITTLLDAGWIVEEPDPLRDRNTQFVLDEPIVRFHRLVVEPSESRLTMRRNRATVWMDALPIIRSRVFGPHLERLAKDWVLGFASDQTIGGVARQVGASTLPTGRRGKRVQIDLVALGSTGRGGAEVLAIGEVKAGVEPVGAGELDRLDAIEGEVHGVRVAGQLKKLIVARAGFTSDLQRLARRRPDVELVDLHRLYAGE
jgi:uncharacterized protein